MNQNNHSTPEEEFIKHIWEEKALWDTENPCYKDLDFKTKIWKEIAEKCHSTEMECKRRWTGLREKYRREKIYNSKLRRSGIATDSQRWPSFEKMTFLDKVYIPRGSYRVYRDLEDGPGTVSQNDYFATKTIKLEENSSDECNIGDYLETRVNCNNSVSSDVGCMDMDMYASPSSSTIDQSNSEGHPFYGRLSKKQIQTLQSQQVWINSTIKSSSSVHDGESSSPSLSQRSEANNKINHDSRTDSGNFNRYQSFGVYIADTLNRMNDKHANELHINILQEIIKIQTKIAKTNE